LDLRLRETRQQPAQTVLRTSSRRAIAGEALVERAAKADRPRAAPQQDAAVCRGTEVGKEHPGVNDRLPAGPADLLEQLRYGLRQDDVRAEVGHVTGDRPPAGRRSVDRNDDLRRTDTAARRRPLAAAEAR